MPTEQGGAGYRYCWEEHPDRGPGTGQGQRGQEEWQEWWPQVQRGGGGVAGQEAQGLACVCCALGEQGQAPSREMAHREQGRALLHETARRGQEWVPLREMAHWEQG